MPNAFAYLALGVWPLVALTVFASPSARTRLAATTAWMVLLPAMFLPTATELKVPGVPALEKTRIAMLSVYLALQLFHRRRIAPTRRHAWFGRAVLAVLLFGTVRTVMTNADALVYGAAHLPGLTSYDILSIGVGQFLDVYLPFTIGVRVFRTEDDLRELLRVLTACGLIYLPLAALEVRLSPQLHHWVYGFFPHQFIQMMRGGSFRPLIFMPHGLAVAFFGSTTFIAALGLRRAHDRCRPKPGWRVAGAALLLVLCKSMASILYATFGLLLEPRMRKRTGALVLVAVLAIVVTFPVTRFTGAFPVDRVVAAAAEISEDRSFSLDFRFRNEDDLLQKAMERPAFGWGTFGRNRVFNQWGDDTSVTDGQWIITLGKFGLVGLAGVFALTVVPVLTYVRVQRKLEPATRMMLGQVAIIVTVCSIDVLPNAWSDALPLVYAGALYTLSRELSRRRRLEEHEAPPEAAAGAAREPAGATAGPPLAASARSPAR